jgi:2-polyprenyl-3-methyl-5-hydroxy-6-metoxy-1,4-benzoquinol methylase
MVRYEPRRLRSRLFESKIPLFIGEPAVWQQRVEEFVLGQIGEHPSRVLEVGCGDGRLAQVLAGAGHRVTAIDPRAPEGPIFRRESIEEFFDSHQFDHVVAILSLHHVEDLGRALAKMADLLRAGVPWWWSSSPGTASIGYGTVGPR